MAIKPFEIQSPSLVLAGVQMQAGATGVVIPGVTQATSYSVEEVDDTGDQTTTWGSVPTVIDNGRYAILNGGSEPSGYTASVYTVEELDSNSYITDIQVDTAGSFPASYESTVSQNMWATTVADPFTSFNPSDWTQIPFAPQVRAGEVENVGGGGVELVNGNNSFVLDADGNVTFQGADPGQGVNRGMVWDYGANAGGVNSEVRQDGSGLTVRAYSESANSGAPVRLVSNWGSDEKVWSFDSTGNVTIPGSINGITTSDAPTFTTNITNISTGSTQVYVDIADNVFGYPARGQVLISNVVGTTQADGIWYYEATDPNQFTLYTDDTYTTRVDGTNWTTYAGGGTAVSVTASSINLTNGNATISSSTGYTWNFDTNGQINIPAQSNSYNKGRIQSANGYPTLLGYGSSPEHGGPELDWMNSDNPNDMGNSSVLRNTLFINDLGLYVGMNENGFDVANNFRGSWRFGSGGSLTIPAGNPNNTASGQIFSDNESSFINLDVQFDSNVLGGMRLGTSGPKPVDIVTGNGSGGFYTWRFDSNGEITTPDGTFFGSVEGPGTFGFYNANNTNFLIEGPNNITWSFNTGTGNITLPTISLGSGVDEQAVVSSQRKLIPPFRYSAVIGGNTPTVVYTATDVNTTSMKVTMQIQHAGLGMEFFEVFATFTGADTYFSVGNRVSPPTIDASTVVVGLGVGNAMKITVTINSGATTSWVTYDAVEFGIAVD